MPQGETVPEKGKRPRLLTTHYKSLVAAGIVLALVDIPVLFLFSSLHADYDPVRQYMSELGESGRPYAVLANAWFVLGSVVLVGFGLGLFAALPPTRPSRAATLLFLSFASLGVAGGLFPCDPGCEGQTWSGWIHRLVGEIGTMCFLPVPLLIWLGSRGDPRWRGFGWVALPVQALLILATLALAAPYYGITPADRLRDATGLLQWLYWSICHAWNIALGVKLLTRTPGKSA